MAINKTQHDLIMTAFDHDQYKTYSYQDFQRKTPEREKIAGYLFGGNQYSVERNERDIFEILDS